MKSLITVQRIANVLRVLSMIGIIFLFIGVGACAVGGIILLAVPMLAQLEADNLPQTAMVLFAEAAVILSEAIAAIFVHRYIHRELSDGTPFTHGGARELLRAGIISIAAPVCGMIAAEIIMSVSRALFPITAGGNLPELLEAIKTMPEQYVAEFDISGGVIMVLLSFLLHYGADISEQSKYADYD